VLAKQDITTSNGALPGSFRFGFAGSTGGSTNVHEILCFQAAPADTASTSIGLNEKEAAKVANGTQAYLAYYYPSTWTGRLTANDLLFTQRLRLSVSVPWRIGRLMCSQRHRQRGHLPDNWRHGNRQRASADEPDHTQLERHGRHSLRMGQSHERATERPRPG